MGDSHLRGHLSSWRKGVFILLSAGLATLPVWAAPDSIPTDWIQQDVEGQFSFSRPPDLQAVQTLPSDPPYLYTGELKSSSMTLGYDFGTNVVGPESTTGGLPPRHRQKWISIAGRDAEEFSFTQASAPVQGIFVPHVATTDHGWAQLTLRIRSQDPNSADVVKTILSSVRFPDVDVSRSVVHIDELMQTLLHEYDGEKKKAAAARLEEIGAPAVPSLVDALHQSISAYQKGDAAIPLIIEALAESHDARVIPILIEAFVCEDDELDPIIQSALVRFGPEAVKPLKAALDSPHAGTRLGAQAALRAIHTL